MPCTYTGSIEGDRALASSERLTEVTEMLCRTLTRFEGILNTELNSPLAGVLDDDIVKWWEEHKVIDARRRKREREELRAKALAKLTAEERQLLGL